jgi:hypothetical protein
VLNPCESRCGEVAGESDIVLGILGHTHLDQTVRGDGGRGSAIQWLDMVSCVGEGDVTGGRMACGVERMSVPQRDDIEMGLGS